MRLTALVLAAGLSWPTCSFSQDLPGAFYTGNEIYERCGAPPDTPQMALCSGYVAGVADAMNSAHMVCIPPNANMSVGQVTDLVAKYLRENPMLRVLPGLFPVAVALGTAFPCKK
jgi:hypothetical protein